MGRHLTGLATLAFSTCVALSLAGTATALSNGGFDAGLTGWSTYGPVSVDGGNLVLADDGPAPSGAWQVVDTPGLRSRLEFEILGSLSNYTPQEPFGFPDIFSASVLLLDDPTGFDPRTATGFLALSVVSLDADGPFDVAASISASSLGGDWLHVALEFDSPTSYIAPTFELFELALQGGDSEVRIDDVVLTAVPEPATATLLLLGAGFVCASRVRGTAQT
jgi:hypothetical protein